MIQASELRIGNWAINYGKHVCIEADDIVDCHHQPYSYEPIQLTPEILEKAGFTERNNEESKFSGVELDVFYTPRGPFSFGIALYINCFWFKHQDDFLGVELKNVHQLQNLYFAITGEELQINLQP